MKRNEIELAMAAIKYVAEKGLREGVLRYAPPGLREEMQRGVEYEDIFERTFHSMNHELNRRMTKSRKKTKNTD